ncbi:Phenylalanyl-tRNA synthetase beta chain [Thioalkalivibrio nitratireducens DSM 14787]|uniref:Phenylalanine--tRNA ligase beta subunit n=1 Tax=Thioalkalivibrio nitratireducens (strain DSM 14787 / UNIQEM 213 / ALEN2) TaxID=1255043 RepID=L0DZT5_THIND|nr:phenylalanine--tRNA ligase subunit beta [Thioalkalivibrio nitratireducens]AGA33871.1 Phenylalanyl-tRNA synthetase beta chain [Thioalkalivibrio nitratireducens DSM 14787]
MRISMQWLREWLPVTETEEELGHRLTMAGLELDAIEPAAPAFRGVRIGQVLSVAPHPDADRLRVCRVDAGGDAPLDIVCGAPNVVGGMRAPVACIGAVLPGDFRIKRSKLRGVESQGMLCSASELGLAESSEGLMALPDDAPVGADFREWLGLDDAILEIDLTPNRADCLGMLGVARETGVLLDREVSGPRIEPVPPESDLQVAVQVADPGACPLYAARVIDGLDPGAQTPMWMRERLRRAGVRPLHPVVDVTNYVLLELGQPMHAFAADAVGDGIEVRFGRSGDRLRLLNGDEIEPGSADLLIANARGPLALAGIMGGEDSAVTADTTRVVLESAHFAPQALAGRARAYGLHTDASHRFERGVDPTLPLYAMERATALIQAIAGGSPGPVTHQGVVPTAHADTAIALRRERIPRVLGMAFDPAEVERILVGLGCRVNAVEHGWTVYPLRARFDLTREEDLIEELARVHGYERLPQTLPAATVPAARAAEVALVRHKRELADLGFHEIVSFSFIAPDWADAFYPEVQGLELSNPISSELAVMRPGLWPGLVRTAAHNLARQQGDLRLFEYGLRFVPDASGLRQEPRLGGLLCGGAEPEHWQAARRGVDFFDAKGVVEALCPGGAGALRFEPALHPALHDGQAARVLLDDRRIGWIGALHPSLRERFDVPEMFLFELDGAVLSAAPVPRFRALSAFPAIRRDLALVVHEDVPVGELLAALGELDLPLLQEARLFDVYRGKGLEESEKSVAFGLILRAFDRTLEEEDVQTVTRAVLEHLDAHFGAKPRY